MCHVPMRSWRCAGYRVVPMRLGLVQLRQPPAQMVGLRLAQVEREGILVGVASRVGLAEPMQQLGSGRMPPGVRREAVDRVDEESDRRPDRPARRRPQPD
jgi:hypothetical protein